jgi:hypothetical protein
MNNHIIQLDNLYFVRLTAETGFDTTQIMAHDGVMIDSNDSQFVQNCVLNIRRHHQPEVYLKPIFLCQYHPNKFIHLQALCDGHYINEGDAGLAIAKTKKIFQKTLDLHDSKPNSAFGSAIKKALDYMYCRENRTLQPVLDPFSIIGYSYPEMSVSFDIHEEAQLLDALDWAEQNELLWPDFQEKIYVCNQCSGGFLSYREVCPHCQSSHTYGEDLVHHFPCAYIGPISDFKKDQHDGLHCPKCNKGVHHIGVDYDKPSVLYHCNTCDTKFQDLYVKAKCLCCQNDVEVQYLQSRKINTYKLTSKGRHAITNGFTNANEEMQTSSKDKEFLSEDTFVSLLGMDCNRAQLESKSIALLAIRLQHHHAMEKQMGNYRFKKLLVELYDILKNELTPLEYIYLDQGHTFYITQYLDGEMDAQHILKAMTERLQELLKRNHEALDSKMATHHILLKDFTNGRAIFSAAKQQLS